MNGRLSVVFADTRHADSVLILTEISDKTLGMRKGNLNLLCRTVMPVWAALVVILLSPIFNSHATDYYVDKDAAGANSGTS